MNNITDFTSIRASAVPAVPRTISATQRLAALNFAHEVRDYLGHPDLERAPMADLLLRRAERLALELAGDAKGER